MNLQIIPVTGIGIVAPGDDLASLVAVALEPLAPNPGDVIVITHKIVSKAEGAVVRIEGDAEEFRRRLIESEAVSIVRRRGDLIIAETRHGFICANAGIDRSNTEPGTLVLLPEDPDRSAHRIRTRLERHFSVDLPVIISDTFGRPWRKGLTDVAIGVSGLEAILDLRGTRDWTGHELEVTEVAVADELAAAADLVMGKAEGIPAALIRGYSGPRGDGRGRDLVRPASEDLFR
ncbi:MAG TPA: coenzyme F420-0:L-glutamate ligase [Acidimicrobiia bacterium]|nr:coenzyme F420-0:L-glutamate ligase [Acidimicrobiia bacterium]